MFNIKSYTKKNNKGFTLIEVLVGLFVFVVVAGSIGEAYYVLINSAKTSRLKISATLVANEQLEVARNLAYNSVGTVGGIPSGVLPQTKIVQRDGINFTVKTIVRSKDDPFDGTISSSPTDTAPADYKKAEVNVTCSACSNFSEVYLTTTIAPRSLEVSSNNGALFVNVFNALGQPVSDANVSVVNSNVSPAINLSDITGAAGSLQLIDVPPSSQKYKISISKDGYSSDRTYTSGVPSNPHPSKPDATVASKTLTQISFSIDKLSTLNISSALATCSSTPNVGFDLSGAKVIGTSPTVLKYYSYGVTDENGNKELQDMEWDTYIATVPVTSTSTYFLAGTLPMLPLSLLPDSTQDLLLVMKPKNPRGLLVSIKDVGSKLPITGATVVLKLGSATSSQTTGRGSQSQSNWSGGGGQNDFFNISKFFDSSGVNVSSGIKLASTLGEYETNGTLESSSFDTGSAGNFYNLSWAPIDQPVGAGPGSVKFQVATNNDRLTWNFIGPDGTSGTYFTSSGTSINAANNGNRYLRYRIYLHTNSTVSTPNISWVTFTFTSACVPSGQVFFDGLSDSTYTIDVTKSGYHSMLNQSTPVASSWQEKIIYLTPN